MSWNFDVYQAKLQILTIVKENVIIQNYTIYFPKFIKVKMRVTLDSLKLILKVLCYCVIHQVEKLSVILIYIREY